MSLFGRVARFFRTDSAAPAPLALAPTPPSTRRDSAGLSFGMGGGFSNPHTGVGVGGVDPRQDTTYLSGWMTDELAGSMWHNEWLFANAISLLPAEAIEPGFTLTIQDDEKAADGTVEHRSSAELVEEVDTRHEDLGTMAALKRADEWERLFGGAAIWAGANDGVADDWAKPLQLDSPTFSMRWLRVVRSRDLIPYRYYRDPLHPKLGQVEVWQVQPRANGYVVQSTAYVHESRLFLYRGERITDDGTIATQNLGSWEFGDGLGRRLYNPVRRYLQSLDNTELTVAANGEGIWQHNGLAGILAADGGQEFVDLVRAMSVTQSVLRARVMGEGQTFTRAGVPMAGLSDAHNIFMSEVAAASRTPRSKLFGEAAGGLGSTGESQHGDWDETKAAHRKHHQLPAYRWITDMILRSLGGRPKKWKVEGKPYRQLDAKQQAELTKLEADTDVVMAQIIPVESILARQIWRDRYQLEAPDAEPAGGEMLPDDIRGEEAAAGAPGVEAPPAEEGPKLAEVALNGAQALAISAIAEKVAAGILPRSSAVAQLMYSFKAPREAAEEMVPRDDFRPRAVESGLETPPAPAEPPRTDAVERTMAALLAELSPDGTCDDCGEEHPLEVDHIEGRGWAPAALSKAQRTARYWQEYDDGVPLRALCRSCNGRDGAANKQGKSGPRHRADAITTGGTVRFTYAPLPEDVVSELEALQEQLTPDDGIPQEIDHVTLVYCPKAEEDIPEEDVAALLEGLRMVASEAQPIRARIQAWSYFDGARKDGEEVTAVVALLDAPGINELQAGLRAALAAAGMEPSTQHSFTPHITLCYLPVGGRLAELPRLKLEFTIDRVCFANREPVDLALGGRGDAAVGAEIATPGEVVDLITPYQRRALEGEDRTSLVATLELVMGIDLAMAERLIPAGPGTFGGDEPDDDPDDGEDDDGDDEELDLDEDEEDIDDDDGEDDGTRHDSAAARVDEERDDCANPIRGEGGLFEGCAPGEGGGGGQGASGKSGRAPAAPKDKAGAAKKAPAKKLTPKQKAAAKAKAVKAKEREKAKKVKERAKAAKAKERAKVAKAKAREKAKKDKAREKKRAAAEKKKLAKAKATAAKLEKLRAKAVASRAKAEAAKKKAEASTKAREEAQRKAGVPVTPAWTPKPKKTVEKPTAADRKRQLEEATRASKLGNHEGGRPTYQAPGANQLGDGEHEMLTDQLKTSFDQPDRIAAFDYTETNAVWQINSKLRKLKVPAAAMGGQQPIQPNLDVTIKQLDGIIAKAPPLERAVTVYRGVKPGTKLDDLRPGDTFQDPAYSSVSTRADLAHRFTSNETTEGGGVVLRISVPKGTRAAALPSKFASTERELLLGRNSKFRVDRVVESHIPNGPREVFVTLL